LTGKDQILAGPDITAAYKHRSSIDQLERGLKNVRDLVNKECGSERTADCVVKTNSSNWLDDL